MDNCFKRFLSLVMAVLMVVSYVPAEAFATEIVEVDSTVHEHTYEESIIAEATCTEAGTVSYTCSCEDSYTEEIPANGHDFVDGACTVCGEADPNYIPPTEETEAPEVEETEAPEVEETEAPEVEETEAATEATEATEADVELDFNGTQHNEGAAEDAAGVTTADALKSALETGGEVVLGGDIVITEMIVIPKGVTATLDLNGKAITVPEATDRHIYALNNKGTLTIKDSTATVDVNGNYVSGSITARGIYNGYNGTDTDDTVDGANLTVDGGTFVGMDANGGAAIFNCANLIINDGDFTGNVAAVNNRAKGDTTIKGGKYHGGNNYVIQNNGGKLTINYATVDSGFGAVGCFGGTTIIEDGEFLPTGEKDKTCHVVYVAAGADVTINGGIFKMNYPANAVPDSGSAVASFYNGTLEINGGTFTSHFDNVSPVELSTGSTIKGGTYKVHSGTASSHAYVTNFLAENVKLGEDGKVVEVKPVAKIGDTSYTSLQEALDAAAAGTGNVTVEILEDVDLTGVVWTPVTVSESGYPVVTVNGNDKTITGLTDMLFAGTWAGGSGLIINDLTIKDSAIVNDKDDTKGTVGVGAFIGFPQASATITLNKCHLVNSTVEGGHWTGGLIGYAAGYAGTDGPVFMNLTIKDCSVTGSTITGKGSAGGVIGHGSGNGWTKVTITNTTVSGNTVKSTGSSDNKAGAVMGTIGAAGQPTTVNGVTHTGGASVTAAVSGNTVTSNGKTITTIYGRQGTPTGTLEITGGTYDANPIEKGVTYAYPAKGYEIAERTDGTYGLVEKVYPVKIGEEGYDTLQDAIDAVKDGETITLQADCHETVTFTQTKDVSFVLDGNEKIMTGSINITARAGKDAPSTLIIKDFKFTTDKTSYDFIKSVETNYYPNNITIQNCSFEGPENQTAVVAVRLKSANNILIKDCTGKNLHSFLQNTAGWKITVQGVTATCSEGGLAMGTAQDVTIRDCNLTGGTYGIRLDATLNTSVTLNGNTVNAYIPVSVRKATAAEYNLSFSGSDSSYTATNTDGVWCAICTNEYKKGQALNEATGNVKITWNTDALDQSGVYGAYEYPIQVVFSDGYTKSFDSLTAAMNFGYSGGVKEKIIVNEDITESMDELSGNIVTENPNGVTIKNTIVDEWIYCSENFTIGEGVTYDATGAASGLFMYADNAVINGTVLTDCYYQRYADTKLTINEPGSMTVKTETFILRYTDGDGEAGIYIVGDNNDETIGLDASVIYFYQGCINAKDADIKVGTYWQTNETDGTGSANLVLDNSNMTVTVNEHNMKATGNSTVTLTNGSNVAVAGGYHGAAVKMDESSSFTKNGNPILAAKVGDVSYPTLQAAIDAAAEGATITLLSDVTLADTVTIPADKSVILELNGKTISMADASGKTAALLKNNGTLTIKDSVGSGKLSFSSTTPSANNGYASNTITNYGTLTIVSGTVENNTVGGACYALDNYAGSTATIAGGSLIAEKTAVRIFNWTDGDAAKAVLNVTGGEILSKDGYGINFNLGNTPVVELNVSGGTITTNDTDYNLAAYIVSKNSAENVIINITGGTFDGYFALNGVTSTTMTDVSISGGSFQGVICYEDPVYGFIYGGNYVEAPSAYLASGYAIRENADGTYGVKSAVEAKIDRVVGNRVVTFNYETLEKAITGAKAGETIILDSAFVTVDKELEIDKNISIVDYGTRTLYITGNGGFHLTNGATVEFDSVNIDISGAKAMDDAIIEVTESATLSLTDVNITGDGYSSAYGIIYLYETGNLNMEGGSIVVSNDQSTEGGVIKANGTAVPVVNITDTTIELENVSRFILDGTVTLDNVDLTVEGGENAINQSKLTVKDSRITVDGANGRALTLKQGDVAIINSTLTFSNCGEGEIRFKDGLTLSIDEDSTIADCTVYADASAVDVANINGQTINGTEDNKASVVNGSVVNPGWAAKIGSVYYRNIADAIKDAQPNDTVTILAGKYTGNVNVNKAITLVGETDAEGKNLVNVTGKLNITADGATVKNINFNNGSSNAGYIGAKNVLVEGCSVVGGNGFRNCYTSGTVTFKDSTIIGGTYGIHFDGSANGNIVIENCDITGWTSFASTITKVTISDTEFLDGNYNKLRFYQDAELNNVEFNPEMSIDFGKDEVDAKFNDCSVSDGSSLLDVIYLGDIAEMGVDVTIDGKLVVIEAAVTNKDEDKVYYQTLTEAFAAVKTEGTITIYKDVTMKTPYDVKDMTLTIDGTGKLDVNDMLTVSGESTLNISAPIAGDVILNNGAILKDSTINGNVFVAGKVIFRGNNTVNMLTDFGTLTDYYGTKANMEWSVEPGASLTMTAKARYGLGYGDKVTITGELTDALTARENLTVEDKSFFTHGIVAQESSGWNCDSSMTVKNAYVEIGKNNSFGNKPGNYGGNYTFTFENAILDGSRITFYEANSKTSFNLTGSDVKTGTFMTRDADSTFTLTNSKVLSTATSNGTDEGNYHAGKLVLDNSELTYSAEWKLENGTVEMDLDSKITAPSITGNGKIVIDATGFEGVETVVTADMRGFTGTVEVEGAVYEITDDGIEIKTAVASVGNELHATLQEAINAAKNGDTVTLLVDNIAENVTVVQAPDTKITIDGYGKDFKGTITVNGKSARYETAALTIKNVHFDATNISKDASINLGVSGDNNTRYTSNVTVDGCTFHGEGQTKVAVKQYTGGCHNLVVTGCEASGLHSLMQLKNVEKGLTITDTTVSNSKNGISIGASIGAKISSCNIDVTGYGVRADGHAEGSMTISGNTISAEKPVVVRNTTGAYDLAVGENNNLKSTVDGNYQVIVTAGDDGAAYAKPTGSFEITGADDLNVYPVSDYVAMIGKVGYFSIAEAITAAQIDETVTILAGEYTQDVSVNKAITVEGERDAAGKNLVNITGRVSVSSNAAVKYLNVHNDKTGTYDCAVSANGSNILIEGCELTGYNGMRYCYAKGLVTIKDSKIDAANFAVHFDGYAGGEIVIDNCNITGWHSYAGTIESVTLKDSEFNAGKYAGARTFSKELNVENCTFENGYKFDIATNGSVVEVTNSRVTANGDIESVFYGEDILNNNITVDDVKLVRVAHRGSEYYKTLQDAIDAVPNDGPQYYIYVDVDVVGDGVVVINKNVAIDLKDHTYTVNKAVGSAGTQTLGFQIQKGNTVAIMNGTIAATTVTEGKPIKMLIQNYADLTLENITLDGTGSADMLYVLSNNCGTTNIIGETNIIAPDGAVAFDAYDYTAGGYTVPTVNVNTTGKITGKIEVSDAATLAISGGTFTVALEEEWCEEGYIPVDNGDGTYTVKVGQFVAHIGEKGYETLDEAFVAAKPGDEVEINVAGTYALSTSGKNIIITGAVDGVVFDNIGAKNMGSANVTFNNVTFDYYPNVHYTGLQHSGNLVYNDCTINGQVFLYGESETFNNCTFNQNSADAYNVWTYGAKEVKFNECTFNSAGKSVLIYKEGDDASFVSNVSVEKSTFNASQIVADKAAIEMDSSAIAGINLTIDGATTATGFGTGNVSGNSLWNNKKGNEGKNNDITVTVNNVVVLQPIKTAQIGDVYYTTVNAAMDAAQADDIVKIFAGEFTQNLNVNEAITVVGETDTAGNNLVTFNGKLNITADGATVKNINFNNGSSSAGYIKAKDVLVEGCSVVGGNGFRNCYTTGTVTFKDSTITGTTYGIHFDGSAGGNIVIDNCDITGWTSFASTINKVTMTDTTFEEGNYNFVRFYQKEVVIDGCTFNEKMAIDLAVDGATLAVTDSTVENGSVEELFYDVDMVNSIITVEGVRLMPVCATVDGEKFRDLQAAIDAAAAGKTVVMVYDVTLTDAIEIVDDMDVTIEGNGKTITGANGKDVFYVTGGKLTLAEGLNVHATTDCAIYIRGGDVFTSANLTKAGDKYSVIQGNGNYAGNVTINGGKVEIIEAESADNTAIYWPQNGKLTINDGEIIGGTAVRLSSGSLEIVGGKLTAFGSSQVYEPANGASVKDTGDALMIENIGGNSGYEAITSVSITGGTFESKNAAPVASYTAGNENVDALTGFISGGYYVGKAPADKLLAEGYAFNYSGGTFGVVPDSVAFVNGKIYGTIQAAVEAAEAGDTVLLLKNFDENDPLKKSVIIDKDITLDLNGMSITADTNSTFIRVQNGANVTVKNGNITSASHYVFTLGASDGSSEGNLTIESGAYVGKTSVASVTKGTLTITGGDFTVNGGNYGATYLLNCIDANYKDGSAKIVVSGGTFHGFNPYDNAAEGTGTNFCAEGYTTEENDNIFKVVEKFDAIARNEATGEVYDTISDAIAAAESGATIVLLQNAKEDMVMLKNGVTLDLNGYTLESDIFIALKGTQVMNTKTTGILMVPQDGISLQKTNTYVPVWNEKDGYYLIEWGYGTNINVGENETIYYFLPKPRNAGVINTDVVKLLQNGAEDNQLKIEARLTWVTKDGLMTQTLPYKSETIIDVYTTNSSLNNTGSTLFYLTVTGYEKFENVTINAAVVSDLGPADASNQQTIK